MWRFYSGVTFLATSLSRTALELEEDQELFGNEDGRTLMKPRIREVYAIIAEASKLLPLFGKYVDTLASGPADAPVTGAPLPRSETQQLLISDTVMAHVNWAGELRVAAPFENAFWAGSY